MLTSIAKLASKHGIAPLKRYGQNFIFDETLCDKIVRSAVIIPDESVALEIGPGPAGLTRSILNANPKILHVIETDSRCLPLLQEVQSYYPNILHIINADALKIKLSEISPSAKIEIIANLPYNIGTKLLTDWCMQLEFISGMTLMLQKEVVDRIIAKDGGKEYGRLSILCQILCKVQRCFDVSPKAFYPQPKIWSSVVRLVPKESLPEPQIIATLEIITFHAFSARRKMLKSSLKGVFGADLEPILSSLGIGATLRAEDLSPDKYLQLAISLYKSN
jgi:16S rRNA (adenine1518-N6/adenine1519-N6)-dimethyltransferase